MGEVYRARDTRLARDVALKILPDAWLQDAGRQARFRQEARTLATLNHQSIAQIYGIDTVEGRNILAMELVPGETLETRIERHKLRLEDVLEIGHQVASGLQVAHDAGVIHRDLKPGNVQITPEGKAKILDFGLAKSTLPEDGRSLTTITEVGTILGTPSYMSPEQIRGRPIDRRADIWSYGCLLFEALTGERPFAGETVPDVLAAIVERDPDLSRLPGNTPSSLRELIARCLDKDPRTRLQDVGEARILLEKGPDEEVARHASGPRWLPLVAAAAIGALATVTTLAFQGSWNDIDSPGPVTDSTTPDSTLLGRVRRVTRLTNLEGSTLYDAVISPDGKHFAFISNHSGVFDAYAGVVDGDRLVKLTHGNIPFFENWIRSIGFDASGLKVWLGGGGTKRVQTVSVQGEGLKPFLDESAVEVDWTPNGSLMAYHTKRPGDPIVIANGDGTDKQTRIAHQPGKHQHFPTFSTDGEWLYLVRGVPATGDLHLFRLRPRGSEPPEQLTSGVRAVTHPTPIDSRHVAFLARDPRGSGPWLWVVDPQTRQTRRLSVGLEHFTSLAASDDGLRLVATVARPRADLWSIRIPPPGEILADESARRFETGAGDRTLTPRFAGRDLYFLSSRGGGDGLWCLRGAKCEEILSGEAHSLMTPPAVSPDGKRVAVVLNDGEKRRIRIVSFDGSFGDWLTDKIDIRGTPCWARDGRSILTGGIDPSRRNGLFRIPLEGDGVETILQNEYAYDPVHSPTDDLIVYYGDQVANSFPLRAIRPDGTKVELVDVHSQRGGERARFLPNGKGIIYMHGQGHSQEFWLLDLQTLKTRQLTSFKNTSTMRTFDIAPDGESIVFARLHQDSDVILIELNPNASK